MESSYAKKRHCSMQKRKARMKVTKCDKNSYLVGLDKNECDESIKFNRMTLVCNEGSIIETGCSSKVYDSHSDEEYEIHIGHDIISEYPSSSDDAVLASNCPQEKETKENEALGEDNSESQCVDDALFVNTQIIQSNTITVATAPSEDCFEKTVNVLSKSTNSYSDISPKIMSSTISIPANDQLIPFSEAEMSNCYFNSELRHHSVFVNAFIEIELRSGEVLNHPLHKLLTEYLKCRESLSKNELCFESLIEEYKLFQERIWTLDLSSITEYGECQDGNPVSATHQFTVAHFNNYIYENISRIVHELENSATESFIFNTFNETLRRLEIQHYIDSLCYPFSFLSSDSPIQLCNESEPRGPYGTDLRPLVHGLKGAISVLFSFQRRPIKDDGFVGETRQWLGKLVSVLLRISTTNDHLFLLHHVLRCPAGVAKWASQFIQPPTAMWDTSNQLYLDHIITSVAVMLLPIQDRDLFLQQIEGMSEDVCVWVIVNSDGEDDSDDNALKKASLKESDLILILNQMPFDSIFRHMLLVSHRNRDDFYDIDIVTEHNVLRSIAVATLLVNLLEKGIANYNSCSYKQFCKLLCRLINHTASYISEHWQLFRETYIQSSIMDNDMLRRLQTEYDEFLMRVVNILYTSKGRIGWQYLTTLPFDMISSHTLWRLYQYLFHTSSESNVLMSEEFMETLVPLPDNDVYYFLTTVTNMGLARKDHDLLFIQSVIWQLFKVGFVSNPIRDKCMKPTRILIANLTSKHPHLISDLLSALKKDFVLVGKYALYLFKELPIGLWKPNSTDILTFSDWLLNNSLSTWENNLGRYILSHLNWSIDSTEMDLFLPRDIHCRIAIIIINTVYLYGEEILPIGSSPIISQSVRQMSSIVKNQKPEEAMRNWAWRILSKLKLHLLDQPVRVVRMALTDYGFSACIPDINSDTEDMRILSEGLRKNQPIACYGALLMTNLGHSIPVICDSCWIHCNTLIVACKYSQVLHILQVTLPYFLDSIDSLVKQEKFVEVVSKLLIADQTYMKMAKNLIVTDFPGRTLKQFAALIQYQVDNFSTYCLPSPNQMVEMWLRILITVWKVDCSATAFLMDKILNSGFSDESIYQLIIKILSELIKNASTDQCAMASGLFSLISWISYSDSGDMATVGASLLPRNHYTVKHSPYFAFFALWLEELHTQTNTQLWPQVLKILAITTGKANIDAAVKKACASLKLSCIPSAWLSIYRWSQYALELPCEHPILPLFWQRFFRLYLHRVPENNSVVCVGDKFFEGSINHNYYKKIKKKLNDCVKCIMEKPCDDEFQISFRNNLIQMYQSFLLWLEEPCLREPEVFLPALSASFNIKKLSEILNAVEGMWMEYIDFDTIKVEQKKLLREWSKTLNRDTNSSSHRVIYFPEDTNIVKNILDRLKSYDSKLPPPELVIHSSVVPEIPRENFLNKSQMLDFLSGYVQIVSQYTKNYEVEKLELNKVAAALLEAFRCLYNETEIEVMLYAACDTTTPTYKRGTVSSIHCAGPALITLKIREGRLNKAIKRETEKNDIDFQRLLKNNVKLPPAHVLVACIVIELAVDTLTKEIAETREAADVALLNLLHDVGVSLFYKLVFVYDSQVSKYYPTKVLFRKMIERLGQTCIDKIENECVVLLKTILNNHNLANILIPHFTPLIVPASVFVRLYGKVAAVISSTNVTFVLDLITKFEVRRWLHEKRPKLVDRSQLIDIISNTLKEIGSQPENVLFPIDKILRRDLCEILIHDFPEHYGEILHIVLKYSAEEKFSCDIWYDVLNSLLLCSSKTSSTIAKTDSVFHSGMTITQMRDVARKYAAELRSLSLLELIETSNMLGGNFQRERLQYGLYGIYPKYKIYIKPIVALHSMIGHALVAGVLSVQRSALANQISEKLWPILLNLFSPWVTPYFTEYLQEPPEAWIQQLADDRSILLPWTSIKADMIMANMMMATFVECLKFIMDALPASSVILSSVCQWYITQFAHTAVKEHILTVVQQNLLTLNWSRYIPSLAEMELMLKVVDQYLPVCHSFLGSVFIDIPWKTVVRNNITSSTAVHVILLNLLIKLANEPNLRQSGKVSTLLQEAQQFHWYLVDASNYEHVLNWFVMSYDSRVLLRLTDEEWNGIDMSAFDLLQIAAGYVEQNVSQHSTTTRKRQIFVKMCVKFSLQLANRYKTIFVSNQHQVEKAWIELLDNMESVLRSTVAQESRSVECDLLLSEFLILLNQPTGSLLPKIMMQVLLSWLPHQTSVSCILQGLIRINSSIIDFSHRGIILETCLNVWFKNTGHASIHAGMEDCKWEKVLSIIQDSSTTHPFIEDTLVANNNILSLYAFAVKNMNRDRGFFSYNRLIQWITSIKPSSDNESKLPVLWSTVFRVKKYDWTEVSNSLINLSSYFQQIINMKPSWSLFGVIGMNKQHVPSLKCKVLCYALISFITVKVNEENSSNKETVIDETNEPKQTCMTFMNLEFTKSIFCLENIINDKNYIDHRITIETAIQFITSKNTTIYDGEHFIITLAKQLYTEVFIHAL